MSKKPLTRQEPGISAYAYVGFVGGSGVLGVPVFPAVPTSGLTLAAQKALVYRTARERARKELRHRRWRFVQGEEEVVEVLDAALPENVSRYEWKSATATNWDAYRSWFECDVWHTTVIGEASGLSGWCSFRDLPPHLMDLRIEQFQLAALRMFRGSLDARQDALGAEHELLSQQAQLRLLELSGGELVPVRPVESQLLPIAAAPAPRKRPEAPEPASRYEYLLRLARETHPRTLGVSLQELGGEDEQDPGTVCVRVRLAPDVTIEEAAAQYDAFNVRLVAAGMPADRLAALIQSWS